MYINEVDLLLGSNLKNKKENIERAKYLINKNIGALKKETEIIETEPVGFKSANNFLNQAIKIETYLSPIELLRSCKNIEKNMGRININSENYTDRIIDIDIIFYNNLLFKSKYLTIPHLKNTSEREFSRYLIQNLNKD